MRSIIICFLLLSQMAISAQQTEDQEAQKMERIQSQKIAFISTKLNLSVEEAQEFWPVYNEFNNKRRALKKEKKSKEDITAMSESEAEKFLDQMITTREKDLDLQKEYLLKFKEILPSKKVVHLLKLENRFKKEIIQDIEKRLKHRRNTNKK